MAKKSSESMSVRFLINSKTERIVYAEAGKEFVDFLFSFLSMPMGSLLNLLHKFKSSRKIGSVSNLYESMVILPPEYMNTDKSHLLNPKFITPYANNTLKIEGGNYYVCSYNLSGGTTHNMSTNSTDICACGQQINRLVQFRQNAGKPQINQFSGFLTQTAAQEKSRYVKEEKSGYVKEMLTFIITDDLKITGSSTITSIVLLNQLNIKDLTDLQEKNAIVDHNKALEILAASLVSTTVLNDVFGTQFFAARKASVTEGTRVFRFGEYD